MLGLLVSTEAMSANTLGLWASTLDSLENTGETKMNIVVKSDYIVEKWDCIAVMKANIAGKMVNISARWANTWATLENRKVRLVSNLGSSGCSSGLLDCTWGSSGYSSGFVVNVQDS